MTNSMIPYSFIPGTKAKAGEVNANFISLAEIIEQNRFTAVNDLQELSDIVAQKADSEDLKKDFIVSETGTNLNDYKTPGNYYFTSTYRPTNIPKGNAGMLSVLGTGSRIKQVWYSDGTIPDIYVRLLSGSTWSSWATNSTSLNANPGYLKLANGIIIQWGLTGFSGSGTTVTFPIAFTTSAPQICFGARTTVTNTYAVGAVYSAKSATSFTAHGWNVSGTVTWYCSWIAIGF